MLHMKEIQAIAASPVPTLTVYVNTQNRNASRHPWVQEHLAWLQGSRFALPDLAARGRGTIRTGTRACEKVSRRTASRRKRAGRIRQPRHLNRDSAPDQHRP
jgi:predicted metal-dependent hydrolase